MWEDLGEYIANICKYNYNDINQNITKDNNFQCKVVEIAIGKFFKVADYLKNHEFSDNISFFGIDIDPVNKYVLFDDITSPNMDIYNNSKVIYSIRPPQELQPYIEDIVNKVGATLIIKPLYNEDLNVNLDMKLVNYKKAVFYESK